MKHAKTSSVISVDTSRVPAPGAKKIYTPVKGRILPIAESADPARRKGEIGEGVCIMPLSGEIFAPFDGSVEMVSDTKDAFFLKSNDGLEVFIYCGIDIEKLGGKGFTVYVKDDEDVRTGQLLIEYDREAISSAGYNLETLVIIANIEKYKTIVQAKTGDCEAGDLVLYAEE
jgi:glucose-specific phosphotransferase system IIA component